MRIVDWPDERGYWWVIDGRDVMSNMVFADRWPGDKKLSVINRDYAPYDKYKFMGPVKESIKVPERLARFMVEGTLSTVTPQATDSPYRWTELLITVPDSYSVPPDLMGKQFAIVFEELP